MSTEKHDRTRPTGVMSKKESGACNNDLRILLWRFLDARRASESIQTERVYVMSVKVRVMAN